MNIAIDGTALWGQHRYTGVEKVVDRIARRLLELPFGHQIRLYVPSDWPGFEEGSLTCDPDRVVQLPFPGRQRLQRIAWQQFVFPSVLARWPADCLFAPAYVAPLHVVCPTLLLVHDLHGLSLSHTNLPNYLHHRLILPTAIRHADRLLVPTRAILSQVQAMVSDPSLLSTVPLGIDPIFQPSNPTSKNGSLLYVGNLEARKGLSLLLKALALLKPTFPELHLILAGKDRGVGKHLKEQARQLHLQGSVQFVGFTSNEELTRLYQQASVLVHPALAEGFGLTPLEAMACGTPVVAVDNPAVRENIGGVALLAAPTPSALATTITEALINERLRSGLIAAGLALSGTFTWNASVNAVWAALNQFQPRFTRS